MLRLRGRTVSLTQVPTEIELVIFRLNNENFVEMISHTPIGLLAIDESHCICMP
jgi:superfamily II DNA helicase RecQ